MVEHGCRKPHPVHPALDAGRLRQVYSSRPLPSISLAVKREKSPSAHNQDPIIRKPILLLLFYLFFLYGKILQCTVIIIIIIMIITDIFYIGGCAPIKTRVTLAKGSSLLRALFKNHLIYFVLTINAIHRIVGPCNPFLALKIVLNNMFSIGQCVLKISFSTSELNRTAKNNIV